MLRILSVLVVLGTSMQCAVAILLLPARLYSIFQIIWNRHNFRKKKSYWTWNVCFEFFLQLISETFLILRRTERDTIKNVYWTACKVPVILVIFWRKISRYIFEKYSNTKFHSNPSSRSRVVPCGRAAAQTDITKLIVVFRNVANARKNGALKIDAQ